MRERLYKVSCSFNGWMLVAASLALLLLPITWVIAWGISVLVHECGHILAAEAMKVPIYRIRVGITGAKIETGPMEPLQELVCALAGPLAGYLLIVFGRWLPLTALFAFFHTLWNLIPIGTLDGARVLRSISALNRKIPCKPAVEQVQ